MMGSLWDKQFALPGTKNKTGEHAYAVMAWALSLQPDIWGDWMECLSTSNGDLKIKVNEVLSWLHYCPCLNKNGG